jgi:hypothetical protein
VNIKGFFVATLSSALDLGVASPDDVLRHVTPDVLAQHLPRPLWARLLTACLGAPRVDAQLVVETIGVPNLCEHLPESLMWTCIAEIAARALSGQMPILTRPTAPGKTATPAPMRSIPPAAAATRSTTPASGVPARTTPSSGVPTTPASGPNRPLTPPPPDARPAVAIPPKGAVGPAIPSPATAVDVALADLEGEEDSVIGPPSSNSNSRTRMPSASRFRQSGTGIGRFANNQRRPQAQAAPPPAQVHDVPTAPPRRAPTADDDFSIETDLGGKDDWKNALAVEDEQLVDWTASEETVTHTDDFAGTPGRKR